MSDTRAVITRQQLARVCNNDPQLIRAFEVLLTQQSSSSTAAVSDYFGYGFEDHTITYDVDGRIDQISYLSGTITYTYDVDGRISTVSDTIKTISYTYDVDGRISSVTYS